MRVLIFGDIYGRVGRKAFIKDFLEIKNKNNPDFIFANVENITSGKGPIEKHVKELDKIGLIDVYTSGNHIFDNFDEIKDYLNKEDSKLIRPANFYSDNNFSFPGKGYKIVEKFGCKILVINLMSQVFLSAQLYNPFLKINEILHQFDENEFSGIFIDFHRETTSEIYAMGFQLDSKITFLYGTHTHVQTNDHLILPNGTGIISDVGMCGSLYSVIGADYENVKNRFLYGYSNIKITQCLSPEYVLSYLIVDFDEKTRKCKNIENFRHIGKL